MSVLMIKHVEMEGPGLIQDCLNEEKIPYQILNLENRARLPKPEDFKGIVILVRSMIVEKTEDRKPERIAPPSVDFAGDRGFFPALVLIIPFFHDNAKKQDLILGFVM